MINTKVHGVIDAILAVPNVAGVRHDGVAVIMTCESGDGTPCVVVNSGVASDATPLVVLYLSVAGAEHLARHLAEAISEATRRRAAHAAEGQPPAAPSGN